MKITIYKDVNKYALTSTLKKEDIELVKKYRPADLKIKDADGNDIFGMSYVDGKTSVSKNGVTFGSVNSDGFAMVTGDISALPEGETDGDRVADYVGSALAHINELENQIPGVVTAIQNERKALIEGIKEV